MHLNQLINNRNLKKTIIMLSLFVSVSAAASNIITSSNYEKQPIETFDNNYSSYLTPSLQESIIKMDHAGMFNFDEDMEVVVKAIKFTPPGWDDEFAYVQIIVEQDGIEESSFVLFSPNENGVLTEDQYSVAGKEDAPCTFCHLKSIEVNAAEHIIGKFSGAFMEDDITTKEMNYNFQEMSVWWTDPK
jgi:hypothetical protein